MYVLFMFIRCYTGVGWTKKSHWLNIFLHLGSTVKNSRASALANTSRFCEKGGFFPT